MPDGAIIDRRAEDLVALPRLDRQAGRGSEPAAFDRLLSLLRITNSEVSLVHLRPIGDAGAADMDRLIAGFEREAMIERLDGSGRVLLFVRRGEAASELIQRLLDRLRGGLRAIDLNGRARIQLSAIHRDSGAVGDADELMSELMFQVSSGASIVAV